MRIGIIVFEDMSRSMGTTLRGRDMLGIFSGQHDVIIINCSGQSNARLRSKDNIKVVNIRGLGMRLLPSSCLVLKLIPVILWNLRLFVELLKHRFDIVYSVYDFLGFPALFAASRLKRSRIIYEAHTINSEQSRRQGRSGFRVKMDSLLERFVCRNSDFIIALAENIADFYRRFNPDIAVVPAFVDSDLFRPAPRDARGQIKTVGLIGPFDTSLRKKAMLEFVYSNLHLFGEKIKLVIIGRCERRVESARVTYTGYIESLRDYIRYISGLDAVLVPSEEESLGPVTRIIEALACGTVVFATPPCSFGLPRLKSGRDILVFPRDEIIQMLSRLIFDERLMKETACEGRKTMEAEYSFKANAPKILSILELVYQDKSATGRISDNWQSRYSDAKQ